MSKNIIIIVMSITMSSFAHLLLKKGAEQFGAQFNLSNVLRLFLDYWIMGGIFLHILALIIWVWALSRVDITFAYPFLSLGYVIVSFIAWHWLGESLTPLKITGMSIIMIGLIVMSHGTS